MKTASRLALCLVVALGLMGASAIAGEGHDHDHGKKVSMSGTISCGKCTLGVAESCQDVLSVAEGGKTTQYWLVKNDVMEKFGHGCKGEKQATVTGTVAEKEGKMWLTATNIEAKSKG